MWLNGIVDTVICFEVFVYSCMHMHEINGYLYISEGMQSPISVVMQWASFLAGEEEHSRKAAT